MKVVIADASCLILLTNIDRLQILELLFGEVWVTETVRSEYGLSLPAFITIHNANDLQREEALSLILDPGEASSIALAMENSDCQVIIDEKKGRRDSGLTRPGSYRHTRHFAGGVA